MQEEVVMEVTLPVDLRTQVEQELAAGRFRDTDELFERAIRRFLEDERRASRRLESLRSIGAAVDQAGLYERVFVPGP